MEEAQVTRGPSMGQKLVERDTYTPTGWHRVHDFEAVDSPEGRILQGFGWERIRGGGGMKQELEKRWRETLDITYPGCRFPINCEHCKFVGNAFWHCHSPDSEHRHLNVSPTQVCECWRPNQGLLIYLWRREKKNE